MSRHPSSAVSAETNKQTKYTKRKAEKRKHFSKELKPKEAKKNVFVPPTDAAEFSANWKNLLMVLNLEGNSKTLQSLSMNKFHEDTNTDSTKQHQTKKRKMNDERERKNQTAKRKKDEGAETKPTMADIWFDDIDPDDLNSGLGSEAADALKKRSGVTKTDVQITQRRMERYLVKGSSCDGLTRAIAMDCEMVGVGPGGEESMLARVSIVNYFGKCVYDKYVKPTEKVTDYRTAVSGIRPADIECGENFRIVQQEVAKILAGRILVGHAIHNDLKILLLDHPKRNIRDTQKYKPFKKRVKSGRPALRVLCQEILNVKVQQGEHSSVQDAQATMRLYTLVKKKWEAEIKTNRAQNTSQKSPRKTKAKLDRRVTPMHNTC